MQTVEQMHQVYDAENDRQVGAVFRTMLLFTGLMVLGPISTYFLSKNYIWESECTPGIFLFQYK